MHLGGGVNSLETNPARFKRSLSNVVEDLYLLKLVIDGDAYLKAGGVNDDSFFRGTKLSDFNQLFLPNYSGKPLLLAEIGVNHDGSVEKAKSLILACKDAGADAVKCSIRC